MPNKDLEERINEVVQSVAPRLVVGEGLVLKAQIKALISQEVQRARIDELETLLTKQQQTLHNWMMVHSEIIHKRLAHLKQLEGSSE